MLGLSWGKTLTPKPRFETCVSGYAGVADTFQCDLAGQFVGTAPACVLKDSRLSGVKTGRSEVFTVGLQFEVGGLA